jgi:hypothetical protein
VTEVARAIGEKDIEKDREMEASILQDTPSWDSIGYGHIPIVSIDFSGRKNSISVESIHMSRFDSVHLWSASARYVQRE